MKQKLAALGLFLLPMALMALPGCGAPEDTGPDKVEASPFSRRQAPTFVENSVNADQDFANSTEVVDGRLLVTTAGNERTIAKITVGTILAGNRSSDTDLEHSKNPYGFLRRVTEIKTEGKQTVFTTERAELSDWIAEGDLIFGEGSSKSIFNETTSINTLGLHPLAGGGDNTGSASAPMSTAIDGNETTTSDGFKVRPFVKFSNADFKMNAKFEGHYKVRKKWIIPYSVDFKSKLTMDPVVQADIEAGLRVQGAGVGIGTTVGVTGWEANWTGPSVKIPIGGPIPITLSFAPRLKCTLSSNASISATVHARVGAHAAVGFEGRAGVDAWDFNDLSEAPTLDPSMKLLGIQGKANLTAECALLAVPVLLAFDAAGLQGEIGPYVSLNSEACVTLNTQTSNVNAGVTLYEQHGLAGEFGGRIQIPLLDKGKDFDLISVKVLKSNPLYLAGNAQTCKLKSVDSCEGRADGFYCSEVEANSGIICEGGQIERGLQCAQNKKCAGGTTTSIRCE